MLLLTPQRLQTPRLRVQSPGHRRSTLEGALAQLEDLNLRSNKIGDGGISCLAVALSKGALDKLEVRVTQLYSPRTKPSLQS